MTLSAPRFGDHTRAIFVALHLFALGMAALPSPKSGSDKSVMSTASAKRQVQFVTDTLRTVGVRADRRDVADRLWELGNGLRRAREISTTPFAPYFRYAGVRQSWRMFATTQHAPSRFTVDIDQGQGWETVYALVDGERRWRAATFEHERVRAVLCDFEGAPRKSWVGFSRRVAGWALSDFDQAIAVRTRLVQQRTALPGAPTPAPRNRQVLTFARPPEALAASEGRGASWPEVASGPTDGPVPAAPGAGSP